MKKIPGTTTERWTRSTFIWHLHVRPVQHRWCAHCPRRVPHCNRSSSRKKQVHAWTPRNTAAHDAPNALGRDLVWCRAAEPNSHQVSADLAFRARALSRLVCLTTLFMRLSGNLRAARQVQARPQKARNPINKRAVAEKERRPGITPDTAKNTDALDERICCMSRLWYRALTFRTCALAALGPHETCASVVSYPRHGKRHLPLVPLERHTTAREKPG